jgi:hypothetical protein
MADAELLAPVGYGALPTLFPAGAEQGLGVETDAGAVANRPADFSKLQSCNRKRARVAAFTKLT